MKDHISPHAGEKHIVALGSTSDLKKRALVLGFQKFDGAIPEVTLHNSKSGVPEQPEGYEEIERGARSRALGAKAASPNATLIFGIENGVVKHFGHFFDVAIVVVLAKDGREFLGISGLFPIPEWAVIEARESDLGVVVQKRGMQEKDPVAYFSRGQVLREHIIAGVIQKALIPYFHDDRYRE